MCLQKMYEEVEKIERKKYSVNIASEQLTC